MTHFNTRTMEDPAAVLDDVAADIDRLCARNRDLETALRAVSREFLFVKPSNSGPTPALMAALELLNGRAEHYRAEGRVIDAAVAWARRRAELPLGEHPGDESDGLAAAVNALEAARSARSFPVEVIG